MSVWCVCLSQYKYVITYWKYYNTFYPSCGIWISTSLLISFIAVLFMSSITDKCPSLDLCVDWIALFVFRAPVSLISTCPSLYRFSCSCLTFSINESTRSLFAERQLFIRIFTAIVQLTCVLHLYITHDYLHYKLINLQEPTGFGFDYFQFFIRSVSTSLPPVKTRQICIISEKIILKALSRQDILISSDSY